MEVIESGISIVLFVEVFVVGGVGVNFIGIGVVGRKFFW